MRITFAASSPGVLSRFRPVASAVSLVFALAAAACQAPPDRDESAGPPEGAGEERPRLVVSLVVDQLPQYLLERYDSLFTGGLRRILDRGRSFPNAVHAHASTETAVGHSTLATGRLPAEHGILANSFYRRDGDRWVEEYAVADPESEILGEPSSPGRSPENLLASGLADWLLLADSASRRVSVSKKDRSAIAHGGQSPGHVYWLSERELRFVSSAYYRDALPDWLRAFNRDELPALLSDSVWESTVPRRWRGLSRDDVAGYEAWGGARTFPHRFVAEADPSEPGAFHEWITWTPFVDEAVLALARRSVEALSLGDDGAPDLLAVGLSQTDYVGHRFGPLSREQLDNLLRLDRALADFFDFLDRRVGPGGWVLGFSADHGVMPNPEHLRAEGRYGHRGTPDDARRIEDAVWGAWSEGGPEPGRRERVARALEELEIVADGITLEDLRDGPPTDTFIPLYANGLRDDRRPSRFGTLGVWIRFREGVLPPGWDAGTSHGSPYLYDRRVPLIFMGPGVEPGRSGAAARTVDFAPTLADLVGLSPPAGIAGRTVLDGASEHR